MSQTINVSRSNFADGKKRLNIRNGLVIYNSINTSKFDPHKQYTNLRKEIGIAHDTTLVGFIARITHQKDPFTLLKAILKITNQNANIHFLIVGNGDLEKDVKKFAKQNNISRSITFLDFRNDIPNVLSAIDIYCLPSLWEGLPIGILEAMSMEKPVITTAIDTNTELICENSNGLLMEPGDSEQLAQHILFLHTNKSIRTKMGIRSREIIQTQFTIDKMIGKIQTLYQNQFNLNQTIKHNLA
jgi:glycosyltransferase involved in cell wall biosynthesis